MHTESTDSGPGMMRTLFPQAILWRKHQRPRNLHRASWLVGHQITAERKRVAAIRDIDQQT